MTTSPGSTTPEADASLNSIFSAVRSLLILSGTLLAAHGYGQSAVYQWVELGAGSCMVIGPAVWGVVTQIQQYRNKRKAVTRAVNAGMNLAASGQMIVRSDGTPLPATDATAAQIVKVLGTTPAPAEETQGTPAPVRP